MRAPRIDDSFFEDREETVSALMHSPTPKGLGEWAKAEKPKRIANKASSIAASSMAKAEKEAERRGVEDDWEGTKPLVFVALYARLHEHVYGIETSDLRPQERKLAVFAAGRMLKRDFDGNEPAAAAFVRWAWLRESGREKWRRENGRQGFRMTWRLLFGGGGIFTDYRLDQLRSKGR